MTRPDLRSGPSRAFLVALVAGGLTLLAAGPASAKKKKSPPAADASSASPAASAAPAAGATDAEQAPTDDKPSSAQAQDVERPKPMLDINQEAPKTDSLGHVHFSSPNGPGLGRVIVNAPAIEKVKVFLEGRFFGTAPVTIFSVPKGDYIVEASYPSGKQVSKPVTVTENEDITLDLGGAQSLKSDEGGSLITVGEMTHGRRNLMYGLLIGGGAALVLGVTFGILDLQAESDYQNTAAGNQAQLDSIQSRGQRDALLADIGFFAAAAAAIGAGICALPLIIHPGEKSSPPATTAFVVAPVVGNGTTGGVFSLRF